MTDKIDNAVAVADDRVELGLNTFFDEIFQRIAIELMGIIIDKFTKILVCRNDIMPFRKRFFDDVAASRYRNRIVDLRRLEFIGKRFDIVTQIGDLVGIGDDHIVDQFFITKPLEGIQHLSGVQEPLIRRDLLCPFFLIEDV